MQTTCAKCELSDLKAMPVFVLSQAKVYSNYRVEYVRVNERLECVSTETESALETASQARFQELAPGEFYLVLLKYPTSKDGNRWIAWQQDLEDHFKAEPDTLKETEDGPVSCYLLDAKERLRSRFGLKPSETLRMVKDALYASDTSSDSENSEDSLNVNAKASPGFQLPPIPLIDLGNSKT